MSNKNRPLLIIPCSEFQNIQFLGEGNFGVTFKALWIQSNLNNDSETKSDTDITITTPVVIKLSKDQPGENEWREFSNNIQIPNHPNILPILGLCPDFHINIKEYSQYCPGLCIITPFCEKGDLLHLLHEAKDEITKNNPPSLSTSHYSSAPINNDQSNPKYNIYSDIYSDIYSSKLSSITSMVRILTEVAQGLAHLHRFHLIHRDIASRNVLVDKDNIAKLSDFGLSRHLSNVNPDSYYKMNPAKMVPIRWLAPESLINYHFTQKSDVWMYGVLLWEILTLGTIPYHHINDNINIIAGISSQNLKLIPPNSTPPLLVFILNICLQYNAEERPGMNEIVYLLTNYKPTDSPTNIPPSLPLTSTASTDSFTSQSNYGYNEEDPVLEKIEQLKIYYEQKEKNMRKEMEKKLEAEIKKQLIEQMEKKFNFQLDKMKIQLEQEFKDHLDTLSPFEDQKQKPSQPSMTNTSFSDHQLLLIIGGSNENIDGIKSVSIYNPSNQTNVELPSLSLSEGRDYSSAVLWDDCVFIIGGRNKSARYLTSVIQFGINQSPLQWSESSSLLIPRSHHSSVVFHNQIFVIGGEYKAWHSLNSVEILEKRLKGKKYQYHWLLSVPLRTARRAFGCVVCNDCIYCIGGVGNKGDLDSVEYLDFNQKEWKYLDSGLSVCRSYFNTVSYQSFIYFLGGREKYYITLSNSCSRYNILDSKKPIELNPLPKKMYRSSACIIDSKIYLSGGRSIDTGVKTSLASLYCYSIKDKKPKWVQLKDLEIKRYGHCMISIPYLSSIMDLNMEEIPNT